MHFKTTLIMGTKNETFLSFLDTEILKLYSRGKILTIVGASVFILHVAYIQFIMNKQEPAKILSPKLVSDEDSILSEMSKF